MADIPYIQQAQEVKITGQDSTGATVNYVTADANGNLHTQDYSDGPVTPGTVASVSTLIGAQYNSTLPTLTAAQQSAIQLDSSGRTIVTNVPLDGSKATYSASAVGLVVAALPTDIFTIAGSASKTIRVTSVRVSGTTTAGSGVSVNILLIKRSSANSGGTSSSATKIPHDSTNSAATVSVLSYTANPSSLGTAVGTIRSNRQTIATSGSINQEEIWEFGNRPSQAIVLRGTSQILAVNLNASTITNPIFDVNIEWTEE